MQQFTVPQFIDVEDKVIGPLSVRQFIILISGAVLIAICYKAFDFTLFVVSGILITFVAALFAFVKISGMPFHFFLLNLFITLNHPGLRVWGKWWEQTLDAEAPIFAEKPIVLPRLYSMSHLNKLSLIVDTKGYYAGTGDEANIFQQKEDNLDMLID
ncbi:MAG: PrgI family protein [Candidatus Falkowbacteria bacterium]